MPTAPEKITQKQSGFCYAACIQSIDNTWGGNYTQYHSEIGSNGTVPRDNASLVRFNDSTASYSGVKTDVDAGSYCIVGMQGKYGHWVVAYASSNATAEGISVMDPLKGDLVTLKVALEREGASNINANRKAYNKNV